MKLEWEWAEPKDHWLSSYPDGTFQIGAIAYCQVTEEIFVRLVMDNDDGSWWVFINKQSVRGCCVPGLRDGISGEEAIPIAEKWVYDRLVEAAAVLRPRIDGRQAAARDGGCYV